MSDLIRLNKRIALSGKYSRHEADKLIAFGRVTVNGVTAESGCKVDPISDIISVDGKLLNESEMVYYKFHKPRGYLSSYHDPNGKANLTAFKELSDGRLGYSGRLDYDSEGLMIFSNDGEMIYRLQRSEHNVEKLYEIIIDKPVTKEWIAKMQAGLTFKDSFYLPCKIKQLEENCYHVILREGKKRQVRRMFAAAGSTVTRLIRLQIGTLELGSLKPGILQPLTIKEIEGLKKCTGLE